MTDKKLLLQTTFGVGFVLVVLLFSSGLYAKPVGCTNDGDPGCPRMMQSVTIPHKLVAEDWVKSEHRSCARDQDCALVYSACCPCAGSSEHTAAVNRQYASQYQYQCSKDEIHHCAENGACAQVVNPIPVCRDQQCVIDMRLLQN